MAKQTKAYLALIYVCIAWGTTYLAIRVGVRHYPAFLFAGIRQLFAGLILIPMALMANRNKDLGRKNVLRQMLVGFLMLTLGNGCVTWGEKYIPSGVAALLCSTMPLFAVLFNLMSSKKDQFNATIGIGMLLGLCGTGLIFRQNIAELARPEYVTGILTICTATISWAWGSIINKRNVNPVNSFFNSGLQLLFGGVFMLIISPFTDSYAGMPLWDTQGLIALVYLIIFGSVIAYAAYMYALSELPMGIATIYAYINPLIAVIAGYLFLSEELNIFTGLAFITIAISVYLVNKGYRKQHKPAELAKTSSPAGSFPENAPVES